MPNHSARNGLHIAILQLAILEIRQVSTFRTVGRCKVKRDKSPQWRQIVWNRSSNQVAFSTSIGHVEVFDMLAQPVFTITNVSGMYRCWQALPVLGNFIHCMNMVFNRILRNEVYFIVTSVLIYVLLLYRLNYIVDYIC